MVTCLDPSKKEINIKGWCGKLRIGQVVKINILKENNE